MKNKFKLKFDASILEQFSNEGRGIFLGYPKCCVKEFMDILEGNIPEDLEKRKLRGTGYVPCSECNSKYTEKELIDRIDSARRVDLVFPQNELNIDKVNKRAIDYCEKVRKGIL